MGSSQYRHAIGGKGVAPRSLTGPGDRWQAIRGRGSCLDRRRRQEQQQREVDDCVAAYGRRPMRVLLDTLEEYARHAGHALERVRR